MIAALQMYDWAEVRPRTDAFWARVQAALHVEGIEAPALLSRPDDIASPWPAPDLVIGQTCGLPYISGRCGSAVVIGRPCYGVEGAEGATYRSALIGRADEDGELAAFRGRHAAINETGSQSGCNALAVEILRQKLDPGRGFFSKVTFSGSHRASAGLVADRKADIAAIDAVAWALFQELEPVRAARLRVIAWTTAMPSLPFICGTDHAAHRPALYGALHQATLDLAPQGASVTPGIPVDVLPADDEDYDPIRKMASRIRGLRLAPNMPPL